MNYDDEVAKLREVIIDLIRSIINSADTTQQSVLVKKFGSLSVFFGRKMTLDNLMPLIIACFNKKDSNLRRDCIKGIPDICARVGA